MNEIIFPKVKNVSAKLLADELTPMTSKEVAEALSKMFKSLKEEFGVEVEVVGNRLPTRVLVNKEFIKKEGY